MKYPMLIAIVVVILVFSTSPNKAQNHKSNERRAAGMVPFPRIGRHLGFSSFARADGSAGLVNYPRVGRSGSLIFEPNGARDYESQSRIRSDRDSDIENLDDFDYSKYYPNDWEESGKRRGEMKNGMWLENQESTGAKKDHRHSHRCNQRIDGPWALLFTPRDAANLNQQPIHNFIPRLAREVEREAANNMMS